MLYIHIDFLRTKVLKLLLRMFFIKLKILRYWGDILFERIEDAIKNNNRVIYLAPTRELIEYVRGEILNKVGSLYNVDVITFDDLSKNISKYFLGSLELISYEASLVLVEEILRENKNNIKYFNKVYDKKGFAINVLNAIRSLKKEYVDIDKFKAMIGSKKDDILIKKTEDLATIYKAYNDKLKSLNLIDMDDVIKIAIENVDKTFYFENVSLFIIDGYIDIFSSEKKLLEAIKNSYQKIEYIYHIPLNVPYVLNFAEKEALGFVKSLNFEIYDNDFFDTKYKILAKALFEDNNSDEKVDVEILDAPCIEDEVRQAAVKIKEIYKEKSIELDKIAVIVPQKEEYEDTLLEIFKEYGIHISLSDTELLSKIPFIKTIAALFRLKKERYNKNLLEDIVTSPYLCIPNRYDALKVLERYFKGADTEAFLDKLPKDFKVENSEEQDSYIEKISKLKDSYVEFKNMIDEKLSKLKDKASFEEYKNAVIDIIDELDIKKRIICLYKDIKISQEIMLRDLKALVGFIDMLNNLGEIYKHQTIDIDYEEFLDILNENIASATVTISPKKSYGVKVLTPDLIRGTSYDYVFIIGLNEGKFPKITKSTGIYTSREKEIIYNLGVNFGFGAFEMEKEKIRFILSIASAKEGLTLSYRTSGEDGSYISKSQFLDEVMLKLNIQKEFKERKVRTMRDRFYIRKIYSRDELVKIYCISKDSKIKEIDNNIRCLDDAIKIEEKRNCSIFTEYDGLIDIKRFKDSNKNNVFSASKIMSYNKCAFKYFIENVLNIKKWDVDVYSSLNFGNIYHYVFENYYKDYINKTLEYNEDKINYLANAAFEKHGLEFDDNYTKITREQLLENIKSFIKIDIEYKNKIKFRPYFIEKEFEIDDLIDGIKIKGRIDRVDMEYDGDNPTGRYIIQDYKISNARGLSDMLKGDAIQVVLYYYVVNNIIEKNIDIKPECLALSYYDVNQTIEKENKKISGIIVAKDDKEFEILDINKRTNTVAKENFDVVITHITDNFIKESIEKIKKAVFTIPKICEIQSGNNFSCDFEDVCRYNKLRLLGKDEVKI